jgi:hypothetical protein
MRIHELASASSSELAMYRCDLHAYPTNQALFRNESLTPTISPPRVVLRALSVIRPWTASPPQGVKTMPISASLAEPSSVSTARNSSTQTFLNDDFVSRLSFPEPDHAETCDAGEAPSLTPVSHNDLAARMRLLIRREGSMASIARRCGFSEGAVRSWRDGQSDISRERCVILARTLNVSLIWLITGDGPMRPEAGEESAPRPANEQSPPPAKHAVRHQENDRARSAHPAVDSRVLAAALRLLQSYVGLLGGSLNPMQRADVLAELYDILRSADEPGYIDRLIAFHSMLSGQMRHGSSLVA